MSKKKNKQLDHKDHRPQQVKHPVCFLLHDMEDARNIGSLFRIADALGVEKIYLSGTSPVPPNKKIKKTSRSTENYVPFCYEEDPLKIILNLKTQGYKLISLEITSASIDIRDLAIIKQEKICLILGAENRGICQKLLDVSDQTIHLTMLGQNSSMNVAVACGIATFEIITKFCKNDSQKFSSGDGS